MNILVYDSEKNILSFKKLSQLVQLYDSRDHGGVTLWLECVWSFLAIKGAETAFQPAWNHDLPILLYSSFLCCF